MMGNVFERIAMCMALAFCFLIMLSACSNGGAKDVPVWYKDADRDGYSDGTTLRQFQRPEGYRALSDISGAFFDCDDKNSDRHPGNREIADDGIDQDCTELDLQTWYADNDLDGYSEDDVGVLSEIVPFDRTVKYFRPLFEVFEIGTDCDDNNPYVNPGAYDTDDSYLDLDCNGNNGRPVFRDGHVAWEGDYIIKSALGITQAGLIGEITGSLVVDPGYDLKDLSCFRSLKKIGKNLIVSNNSTLTNFSGLDNLTRIGGAAQIYYNSRLVSLEGLEHLEYIGGALEVFNCDAITNINNLQSLSTLGSLTVTNNPLLTELDVCLGGDVLDVIDGDIILMNNDRLCQLAFDRDVHVAGDIIVSNNQSLKESHIRSVFGGYEVAISLMKYDPLQTDHNLNDADTKKVFYGDYTIASSDDMEKLIGCEWITGTLRIKNVNTLYGLERLKRIGHDLIILSTDLTDLTGLGNLSFVGRDILIIPTMENNLWTANNSELKSVDGLENLTEINGSLVLARNSELTDLSGLRNVRAVGGDLMLVENTVLTDFSGLANIATIGDPLWRRSPIYQESLKKYILMIEIYKITTSDTVEKTFFDSPIMREFLMGYPSGGNIIIYGNSSLEHIGAFHNLDTVRGSLVIQENGMLKNIDGFSNVSNIEKSLMIDCNASLVNMESFKNITKIGGDLIIKANPLLTDMAPFYQVQSVGRNLRIRYNDGLENLEGLNALTRVNAGVAIFENPVLASCDGLENLVSVGDYFRILSNPLLSDIDGFENLCSVGMSTTFRDGKLRIDGNLSLCTADIESFLNRIRTCGGISGAPDISANGSCN